jgi:hypothetical protein
MAGAPWRSQFFTAVSDDAVFCGSDTKVLRMFELILKGALLESKLCKC